MHPVPCTLHPPPCTLYPAPCTHHHAPCTLYPAPSPPSPPRCFRMSTLYCWRTCLLCLHPTPCTLNPVSSSPPLLQDEYRVLLADLLAVHGPFTLHPAPTPPHLLLQDEYRVLLADLPAVPAPYTLHPETPPPHPLLQDECRVLLVDLPAVPGPFTLHPAPPPPLTRCFRMSTAYCWRTCWPCLGLGLYLVPCCLVGLWGYRCVCVGGGECRVWPYTWFHAATRLWGATGVRGGGGMACQPGQAG